MKLLMDIWSWLKEWNDWGMKDLIKAGIVAFAILALIMSL